MRFHQGMLGKHHSEETKAKMRDAHLGSRNHNFGKHMTEEQKTKIRMTQLSKSKTGDKSPSWKGDEAKPYTGRKRANTLFPCPKGFERHHIDGNPLNNAPENIAIITHKQHMGLHHVH